MNNTRFRIQHIGTDGKIGSVTYTGPANAVQRFERLAHDFNLEYCPMSVRLTVAGKHKSYGATNDRNSLTIESYEITDQPSPFGLSSRS
jgi:hypothetical protein